MYVDIVTDLPLCPLHDGTTSRVCSLHTAFMSLICFEPLLACSLASYIVCFPIYLFHFRHVNYNKYLRFAFICTQLDPNPTSTLDTSLAFFISFGLRVDAFLNHPSPPQIDLLPQWYWRTWQLPQTRRGGRSFFPPKSLAFRAIPCCPLLPRLLWACLKTACIRRSRGWPNRRVKVYLKMVRWDRGVRKWRGT